MPRPDAADKLKANQPPEGPSKVLIAAVIAVALVIVGGIAWLRTDPFGSLDATPPKGGNAEGAGVVAYPGAAKPGTPTVDLYEDFQCPVCGQLEERNGRSIFEMAKAGDIKLVVHLMSFLDGNLDNDSSKRAANAAFCASDAGRFPEFHAAVFAAQPEREGDGYSDATLKQAATTAGITGSARTTFDSCMAGGTYDDYVDDTEKASGDDGVEGTPTVLVGGEPLEETALKRLLTTPNTWPSVLQAAS
mgnify:CR=1 FL=1